MKILCTSDWHLHNFKDYARNVQVTWKEEVQRFVQQEEDSILMNSRLLNTLEGLCDMRDYCITHNVSEVLMAGDMFHKRGIIDVTVYNATYKLLESFRDAGIKIHAISGNHDQVDMGENPQSSLYPFRNLIHVIDQPEIIELGDLKVVAVPYRKSKEQTLQSIEKLKKSVDTKKSILMVHLGMSGGKVGSGMFAMSDEFTEEDLNTEDWGFIVMGHYHQPQVFPCGNMFYCGTPVQNSFSDELPDGGYNGFYLIDTLRTDNPKFKPIKRPRFITIKSQEELKSMTSEDLKNNFTRIRVKAEEVKELEELCTHEAEIKVEVVKDYASTKRSEISISDTFEKAVKTSVKESDLPEEVKPKYTTKGLEILAKAEGEK